MSFWDKTVNNQTIAQAPMSDEVFLDEQAVAEIQGPSVNVFDEEEEDLNDLMSDASLRLEQGRLYQMVLQQDIFAETNADSRAIRNVQREIRKHAKERLEILLGIRHESQPKEVMVAAPSQFNDTEVVVLKMLASKVSQGATEKTPEAQSSGPMPPPKKDGITAISGPVKHSTTTPLNKTAKTPVKPSPTPTPSKGRPLKEGNSKNEDPQLDGNLKKPIEEMTQEELAAHDSAAIDRRRKNYAAMPSNLIPHPSPQQLEMKYMAEAQQVMAPGSAISTVMALMNNKK